MVPGQHHVRMNMYIAQARRRPLRDGQGASASIEPNERLVESRERLIDNARSAG